MVEATVVATITAIYLSHGFQPGNRVLPFFFPLFLQNEEKIWKMEPNDFNIQKWGFCIFIKKGTEESSLPCCPSPSITTTITTTPKYWWALFYCDLTCWKSKLLFYVLWDFTMDYFIYSQCCLSHLICCQSCVLIQFVICGIVNQLGYYLFSVITIVMWFIYSPHVLPLHKCMFKP